jgi:hypothetical protein
MPSVFSPVYLLSRLIVNNQDLIVRVLRNPETSISLDSLGWDLLVRQSRRANLLGTLAFRLKTLELLEDIPDAPKQHLLSALKIADRQAHAIKWEIACISKAMQTIGVAVILLKGAAYVMAQVSACNGRTFSDVDILVPKSEIGDVESALMIHGWHGNYHDAYDQRYYRRWMHEIPPMAHLRRGTTIDVHHTILPETARIKVNTGALFDNPLPVDGFDNVFVLKPIDMVLHSATHLFHEGELDNGLRDLFDLDELFHQFGGKNGFWEMLFPRAKELSLERPLYYALTYLHEMLGTHFPQEVMHALHNIAPPLVTRWLMDACYLRALRPNHLSCHTRGTWMARKFLYIRSHWIKMPFPLLVYHLGRKALIRPKVEALEKINPEKQ